MQSLTNIEMFLRCGSRVITILIRHAFTLRAQTISSLARTSGRWAVEFTTGRPERSFVLLGELHLLPLHLSRASVTSRVAVFINACRHVLELISYSDKSPAPPLFLPSEVKRNRGIEFFHITHKVCSSCMVRKFPWRYHRVWPTFDSTYSLIIDTYQLLN